MKLLNLICLLLVLPTTGWAAEGSPTSDTPLQWRDGDRVVLLGDAFVERLQAHGYLESLMAAAFPQRNIQVRNLGWSGDTVTGIARALFGSPEDGFERLKRDVNAAQPTVILVAYGANEAFAGESGLPAFAAQLNHLLDALEATRARLVLLSPHRRLPPPSPLPDFAQYNRALRDYCEVLRTAAEERHLAYVDLYDLLDAAGGDGPRPDAERLTDNGMHLSRFGYWQVAPLLAARLGIPLPRWEVTLSAEGSEVASLGTRVAELARTDQGLRCQLHDEHLSYPRFPAGDTGPSHPLAPAGKLTVTGLSPGKYHLHIDGHEIVQGDHTQWQAGIVLPRRGDEARFERLRGEIVRKNDLYFHRYRPQNETYLFLFRKHEQGNNAVEIPQFDPLIAQAEKRIAQLAKTQPRTLELRRVSH